ncbi:hypothetical protein DJ021_14105 [Phenylobacterium hankyongense]|uniref:Uncharacterized protein n=1 Tax=Phenylobacterium hankyongense TaxID=1813876 RepID=A0A328B0D5_9CAUL|nr:hypothetical protein [Phenylobacterium hankyongense]RAK60862.1 hypothetical protein DJ021_14105 [Phenylobacterium hankyongense]
MADPRPEPLGAPPEDLDAWYRRRTQDIADARQAQDHAAWQGLSASDASTNGEDAAAQAADYVWGRDPHNPHLPAVTRGDKLVLDTIAGAEGTTDEQARKAGFSSGYDVPYGYLRRDPAEGRKPLTGMTLDEIQRLQASHQAAGVSDAMGRYQIQRQNIVELAPRLGLTGRELFTPELQDRLGRQLLTKRNFDQYVAGQAPIEAVQGKLAREWSSLPDVDGFSHYARDRQKVPAKISSEALRQALEAARKTYQAP